MLNHEMLLEYAESYLKSLIAEVSPDLGTDFDSSAPFGELGIDSFHVLKVVKAMEVDFGTLPKTLLFENFNVDALAQYFVDKHAQTLQAKHAGANGAVRDTSAARPMKTAGLTTASPKTASSKTTSPTTVLPIRMLETDLARYPSLQADIQALYERYKNEGGVSRGTRNIAPNLFIGSSRKGYFNYSRGKDVVLVYAYTGPEDYFSEIAAEMHRYCNERKLQLSIFIDRELGEIDGVAYSSTPFGALQRVRDVPSFSLEGGAMRRLRYQVSKFEKAGTCRTVEYRCGTDQSIDQDIASVMERWCETKTMVNPLIHIVKKEILAGTLHDQHRIFLTYLDDVLQNVILITGLCGELNGYLMDLEFYPPDMPQGGLEYAIVNIVRLLATEGCDLFSLGGTYGCRLTKSETADPELDRILDELHRQNIFNDESNLQFKNKFRPENRTIYICRPADCGNADNIVDIIMMIADPGKAQAAEIEDFNVAEVMGGKGSHPAVPNPSPAPMAGLIEGEAGVRAAMLADYGFNPLNLPSQHVEFDLKTDSWAQLDTPYVASHGRFLRSQLQQPASLGNALREMFPFKHFVLTDAGRTAEYLLCKAWPSKGIVLQNLLFPTGLFHQVDQGFTPVEIPDPSVFDLSSSEVYKGGLSWQDLQEQVERRAGEIAYVCVELADNASGGHGVRAEHLAQVKALLGPRHIPLVVDATRVLDNALLLTRDAAHAGRNIWDVARDLLSYADVVVGSLAKNFGVAKGGIVCTNDDALMHRLQSVLQNDGGGLSALDKKLIAVAFGQRKRLETFIQRRGAAVQTVWQALASQQIPVVHPAGGHCVLIDVKRIAEFAGFAHPVAAFVAWVYLRTGIRVGAHSVGMQKRTPLNGLVRVAIPVGLKPEQADEIARRLVRLFQDMSDIPELALPGSANAAVGNINAEYVLVKYHNASLATHIEGTVVNRDQTDLGAAPLARVAPAHAVSQQTSPQPQARSVVSPRTADTVIAVVGMAGRYPRANNLVDFWDNLRNGRDCITEISDERMARRANHVSTRRYRGGFIDGIDKFDSLFFNISPREAEALDPQERLFLEVAWETLEDAGYYPEIVGGGQGSRDVGVFVGAVWTMYQIVGVEEKLAGNHVNPNSFLWSIANRVSYWMNLTGPSLTVDTACSSSLTALYLACEAISRGDCSSAIVGGVNLDLHQHKFDINWAGGALSLDGVCRSFGDGANGYVAGEGVGAILIKPLERALAEGDHVYGVIRSATANHGGRTSGYTVPNPKAQAELISLALQRAQVDARSIGYIEAHGTGTELGDPIEIAGLASAFERDGAPAQSCAIGSVKSNIGHLEAAAGVVSVSKVLLQMRHQQIVPSLHATPANPHIDFDPSPFYVQKELAPWPERTVDGQAVPRRAGVSSFGAGGANAHIVLEHYVVPRHAEVVPKGGYVFPLSARTEDQLRDVARRLHDHLARDSVEHRLDDIAYTLQNGRKSFEYRTAIIAGSWRELSDKLAAFVAGRADTDVLSGRAGNSESILKMLSRKERQQFVDMLAQTREPHRLAQLWIDGLLADCPGFSQQGRRTSLPTYPFADKRHWIDSGPARPAASAPRMAMAAAALHPMLDSNESTFQRQLFKKRFHAQEMLLRDHVVAGRPTLSGTSYLDMARKAGELAAGRKIDRVRNIIWVNPLAVEGDAATDVVIELKPGADSALFEVFSLTGDGKRTLFAQGRLVYANDDASASTVPQVIDIEAIRAKATRTITGSDAYASFRSAGLEYGPSFQLLQSVHIHGDEILGRLELPQASMQSFGQFVLHPCILDASMQAGVVGQLGDASGVMKIPYSIGEVEILHPLTPVCYSYVTKAQGDASASGMSRENVAIVDESGKVLARIHESVGVALSGARAEPPRTAVPQSVIAQPLAADGEETFERLYYVPTWEISPPLEMNGDVETLVLFDVDTTLRDACRARNRKVVLVMPGDGFAELGADTYVVNPLNRDDYERLFRALESDRVALAKLCYAWTESIVPEDARALAAGMKRGVQAFFVLCQALFQARRLWKKLQLLYVYFTDLGASQPHNAAMAGFASSLRLEAPQLDCKVLEIQRSGSVEDTAIQPADRVLAELHADAQHQNVVRYVGGARYTRSRKAVRPAELLMAMPAVATPEMALKHHGVYLITGGAGGLGLVFGQYLAQACQARLVLTGRSSLNEERQRDLDTLRDLGAEVVYISADVARRDDVETLLQQIHSRFGSLNGIVHSAGVLRDSLLVKKSLQDLDEVCGPKVFGAFHLDELTRDEPLDFFALFSSLAAFGNIGQVDYAFANHYMDAFAFEREQRRTRGERYGKTLSLNWSLWAEGGMTLDAATEAFFRRQLGIRPLSTEFGLAAFTQGLLAEAPQLAVLDVIQGRIERAWGLAVDEISAPSPAADTSSPDLTGAVTKALSASVIELLKLDPTDFSVDGVLTDLGFDSMGLMDFANAINERYGLDVNPTMFFEFPSVRTIAGALVDKHYQEVNRRHATSGFAAPTQAAPQALSSDSGAFSGGHLPIDKSDGAGVLAARGAVAASGDGVSRTRRFADMPIAIVGIGGVMPQAENLEVFWESLKNARNLVTEIPRDRWIWEEYDGNPVKEVNKSNSRWGGFMNEVDKFDPLFFGITPREAEMMDPQQRIFLQTVWSAIEDSGQKVSDLAGSRTGLFVGVSASDYVDVLDASDAALDGFSASGNSHSILANRVSFLLNLRGPSAPIDTACSSSLIALHRAVESIHTGSSDMAIVGGVQVMLTPVGHISLSSAGMLSVDGKCKTFDKDANGYVRGEGSGAVFLKPLAQAERDGNPIYAVIRGTAENHGGRVTMLTAPNPKAQAELLVEAYEKADVDPATVGYIECHGTGTGLGDPIEIQALKSAFGDLYQRWNRPAPTAPHCGLSSVKTNIGHLEPAAGIAGLLKVLLSIKHKQIPASLHFETPNPYIDLAGTPFYIASQTRIWDAVLAADGVPLPRRAGVSAFGWGGANAHIVLEEYVPAAPAQPRSVSGPQLVVLSARNDACLKTYARNLAEYLSRHPESLADVAYTTQIGRDAMQERLGAVVDSVEQLVTGLVAVADGAELPDNFHHAQVSRYRRNERGLTSVATVDADSAKDIAGWIASRDYARLARAWVKGATIDWAALHTTARPRRLSLPTYPFARERHWITPRKRDVAKERTQAAALHPLLHANDSTMHRQYYRSVFTGREFALFSDSRRMPAAVQLEMARAAFVHAKTAADLTAVMVLRNVHWASPASGTGSQQVVLDLFERGNGQVLYEIHSDEQGASGQVSRCLHGSGIAAYEPRAEQVRLDPAHIRALMRAGELDAPALARFRAALRQGDDAALSVVRRVFHGHREALLELALPTILEQDREAYGLHPALLDAVLGGAQWLAHDMKPDTELISAPKNMARLEMLVPCQGDLTAWLRYAPGSKPSDEVIHVDIDVMDSAGSICSKLRSVAIENPHARSVAPVEHEEISQLLDAVYRSRADTPVRPDADNVANDEFRKPLEEIL
ncbi:SDR family NAD(P)-dependent oxidoreductase [Bordetella tumulicola]|uniref:SDR family NAD(P)-dependent oxidoreductase n=1 Tax=Bordetella tumulicola TaxID=1649133 RepID=UPI0039EE3941